MATHSIPAPAPSAVRFFSPDAPQLARTLRGKLEAQRRDLAAQIADGYAQDWADYKHRVGVIKGIDEAIQQCITIESDLKGD